jgi:hypothetical protein
LASSLAGRAGTSAPRRHAAVAGRVDAEHRFVLFQQRDDRIESLVRLCLTNRESIQDDEGKNRGKKMPDA